MNRVSGPSDVKPVYKIELYKQDGTLQQTLQPFNTINEARMKLRELGEPWGAKILLLDG